MTVRASSSKRGYGAKWQRETKAWLQQHPWCRFCASRGRQARAVAVDHIRPHKGNPKLFWDRKNWQGLCETCHNSAKQSQEVSGRVKGCDVNGFPADPNHPWNGGSREDWIEDPRQPEGIPKPTIPVTLVCGPPAAGKSTFVRERAAESDLVIDLDVILREIAGQSFSESQRRFWVGRALRERNKLLRSLDGANSGDRQYTKCWFIIGASSETERDWWARQLDAEVVVLDTPAAVCLQRIRNSSATEETKHKKAAAVRRWWRDYRHVA